LLYNMIFLVSLTDVLSPSTRLRFPINKGYDAITAVVGAPR
jgi:hypothetical protein